MQTTHDWCERFSTIDKMGHIAHLSYEANKAFILGTGTMSLKHLAGRSVVEAALTESFLQLCLAATGDSEGIADVTVAINDDLDFEMLVVEEPAPAVVGGRVVDAQTDQPLANVSVNILSSEVQTLENGVFFLPVSRAGASDISCQLDGYSSQVLMTALSPPQYLFVGDIELAPEEAEPPPAPVSSFADDFSTDKGWINETSDHFSRDAGNEWLSWHIHRSTDERYYIPVGPYVGEFRLQVRLKATDWANNCDFYFGLAEDLSGSWPTGAFASFGWFGAGVGNRVVPRITFSDGSPSVGWNADDPSTYINYDLHSWYRVVLEVEDDIWTITVYDDSDGRVGQLSGAMPATHAQYRYLVLFNPYDGDWPTGDGLLDDLVLEGEVATP